MERGAGAQEGRATHRRAAGWIVSDTLVYLGRRLGSGSVVSGEGRRKLKDSLPVQPRGIARERR